MQRNQKEAFLKFCWFINGTDKLIGAAFITVVIGIFCFSLTKETMSIVEIVIMEFVILIVSASLVALYFYSNYSAYLQFISGSKIQVKGGHDFLKGFSSSFWEGESTATMTFRIEVGKAEGAEVRKAITDFVSHFVEKGSQRFVHNFSAKGWEVKAEVMLGKSSNYFLSELISNVTAIQNKFPTSTISLALNTSGETMIQSTREESADETWAEARWRHDMERNSHDNDLGGNHTHNH